MGFLGAEAPLKEELYRDLEQFNQRRHERFHIEDHRHWHLKIGERHCPVFWLKDFSSSGVQLRQSSRRKVKPGDTFRIHLKFDGKDFLHHSAVVKWVKKDEENVNMNRIGLEFLSRNGDTSSKWKFNFQKKHFKKQNLVSADESFINSQVIAVEDLKRSRFQVSELALVCASALPFLAGYLYGYLA
ncbi:MAG: PilZ domain-containing protein [Bdellovibrionales bacterium]|nr:PilZ domain-containing protein [Bdellovibrionales bacterium]